MASDARANVFSAKVDPVGVLETLRGLGRVTVDGPDDDWRTGEVVFPGGGLFRAAKRLKIGHDPEYYAPESFRAQLTGMQRYVFRGALPSVRFLETIRSFRFNVNLDTVDADPSDPRWAAVLAVCRHLDGIIFVPGAFLDADGRALHRMTGPGDPRATPPARAEPNPVLVPSGPLYDRSTNRFPLPPYREAAVVDLTARGFLAPWWLPTDPVALRSPEDIARRLLALQALFAWVAIPGLSDAVLRDYADANGLVAAMTEEEATLFRATRAEAAEAVDVVGWRLENMWPLAWALGFEPAPEPEAGMIDDAVLQHLVDEFLPDPREEDLGSFVSRCTPRTADEVGAMEDLFYCAHHAVRSAQLGQATVPEGFHPIIDGGVIHERRHALSWMIGGDVSWQDTNLAT